MTTQSEYASRRVDLLVEKLTGDELVEIGVGLIGRGLFRESKANGVKAAAALADVVSSTTSAMHLDFRKAASAGAEK